MADGLLKPYLLGRGVETPMPIVLIGALGGMAAEGLIGLFVGAVMLSVSYKLLMSWVDHSVTEHESREDRDRIRRLSAVYAACMALVRRR